MSPNVTYAQKSITQLCLGTQTPTTLPCVQAAPSPEGLALYQTPTGSLLLVQKSTSKDPPHYKIQDPTGAIRPIPDAVNTKAWRKQYFCTSIPMFGITANRLLVAPLGTKQPNATSYGIFQTRGPNAWLQINTLEIPESTPHVLLTDGRFIVREHIEDPHNPNSGPACIKTFSISSRTWMRSEDLNNSYNTAIGCYYALPGGSLLYLNMGGTFAKPNITLWQYDFVHRELNSTRFQFKDGTIWGDYRNHTCIASDGSFSLLGAQNKSPAMYFGATHGPQGAVNGYTLSPIKDVKGNEHTLTIVPLDTHHFAVLYPDDNTTQQKPVSWFYEKKNNFPWGKLSVPFVLPNFHGLRWYAVNSKILITSSAPHHSAINLTLNFSEHCTEKLCAEASIQHLLSLNTAERGNFLKKYRKPENQQALALLMHGCLPNIPLSSDLSPLQRDICVTALEKFANTPQHTVYARDALYWSLIQESAMGSSFHHYILTVLPGLLDINVPKPLHLAVKRIFAIETNRTAYGKIALEETRHDAFHALTLAIYEYLHPSAEEQLINIMASIARIFPTPLYASTRDELWRVIHGVIDLAYHLQPESTEVENALAKIKACVAQIRFINAVRQADDATLRNEIQRIIDIFMTSDAYEKDDTHESRIRHFAHRALESSSSNAERCITSLEIAEELRKTNNDMWFDYIHTVIPILRESNAEVLARFTTLLHNAHKAGPTRHALFHPVDAALNQVASLWITHHRPTHFWNALQPHIPLAMKDAPHKKLAFIIQLLHPFRKHWTGDTLYDWRNSLLGNILSSIQPIAAQPPEEMIIDACSICKDTFEKNECIVQYKDTETETSPICHATCLVRYIDSGNCSAIDVIDAQTGQAISTTQWMSHGLNIDSLERWIAFTGRHLMAQYHQDLPYEPCTDIACIGGAIVEHKDAKQLNVSATQRALLLQEAREETRCCLCDKTMNTLETGEARRQAFERQIYRLVTGLIGITCNGANITRECPHCAHADEKDTMCAQIIGGCPNCHKPWNWHTGTSDGHEFFMEGQPIQAYTLKSKCIERSPLYIIGLITKPNLHGAAAQKHIAERLGLENDVINHNGSLSIPVNQLERVMVIVEARVAGALQVHWYEEEKIAKQKAQATGPSSRTRPHHAW